MAEERAKQAPPPQRMRGPRPKLENPGKIMGRLMKYMTQKYMAACIGVLICIFLTVCCRP